MILSGWAMVAVILLVLLITAIAAVVTATRGWLSLTAIALLTMLLMPFFAIHLFGDVSRVLPAAAFSDGLDGKDQIIVTGVLSALLTAIIAAAGIVALTRGFGRRLTARR